MKHQNGLLKIRLISHMQVMVNRLFLKNKVCYSSNPLLCRLSLLNIDKMTPSTRNDYALLPNVDIDRKRLAL
eukprot:SAG31_NODE_4327_length_3353_cov_4.742778_6_plen_72_part_00